MVSKSVFTEGNCDSKPLIINQSQDSPFGVLSVTLDRGVLIFRKMLVLYCEGEQVGTLVDCGKIAMQPNIWHSGTRFPFLLSSFEIYTLSDQSPTCFHWFTSSMVARRLKLGL